MARYEPKWTLPIPPRVDNKYRARLDHSQIESWQWMADRHCGDCTVKVFGLEALDDGSAVDGEGNPLTAIYSWDDVERPDNCGTCGDEIGGR